MFVNNKYFVKKFKVNNELVFLLNDKKVFHNRGLLRRYSVKVKGSWFRKLPGVEYRHGVIYWLLVDLHTDYLNEI